MLLALAVDIYQLQFAAGRHFLRAHPATATCWGEPAVERLLRDRRVGEVATRVRKETVAVKRKILAVDPEPVRIEAPAPPIERSERAQRERQKPLFVDLPADTELPPLALLDAPPESHDTVSPETLEYTSRLIEKKLSDFGVSANVVAAYPGPVITRYEIEPATGIKGSMIVNLSKDLARALSLVSIRVVETIPGKSLMGLELPNARRQSVRLSEVLASQVFADSASPVTLALGHSSTSQSQQSIKTATKKSNKINLKVPQQSY